jgi:hypothetical protein
VGNRCRLRDDAETRYIDDILRLILGRDPAPLGQARPVEHRFVGVCRDMALLLWDVWGRRAENDEAMTEADHRLYDRAAKVTGDDVPFEQVRALFDECDELRTPRTVLCAGEFHGPVTVTLRTPDRYA